MSTAPGKKVVVTGATGNVGTSVVRVLGEDPEIASILALARRIPEWTPPRTTWASVDLGADSTELTEYFRGADAVIHLAWLFQPTHRPAVTWRTNVLGSIRVFRAAAEAGVPVLVHASSVGAYSPGPKDRTVDETWPTHGWPEAAYCREKAYLERVLDTFDLEHPGMRVVRMRPAFIFKRESAGEQRRLFAGPLLPTQLLRPSRMPLIPDIPGLRFEAMHTDDAARAYHLAVKKDVRGAFNLAAEPPVDAAVLAELMDARVVRLGLRTARSAVAAAWGMHLVPASPHLLDAVLRLPLMDCAKAREELGWRPERTAIDAIEEFLTGLREGSGMPTAPLASRLSGGGRVRELMTGIGSRP
ncbi:NAD-dependent epimerase/dehydratase family protein [Streptomyces sp. GC420]|uniref:NAD-dependent epimerase/dehydratase family protein n=1 Tax=Streptomyces sp. GC420 TaxID=2697568 RepID=UPI0014151456|nr:NAD-dependent epimerase/dehydratase family protein [Streptomyces sp. GC420]NBM18540.1 NAD-dependent epimerase/dehydratase family protein [Streptomyces sp. GC420]